MMEEDQGKDACRHRYSHLVGRVASSNGYRSAGVLMLVQCKLASEHNPLRRPSSSDLVGAPCLSLQDVWDRDLDSNEEGT